MHALRPLGISFVAPLLLFGSSAFAQVGTAAPPTVGVITAEYRPMTESIEINGRIQAQQRVDLIARVTGFLNEQLFSEGAQVKKSDLLYRLERAPFEADVEAKQAAVAQAEAQFENADIALNRAETLVKSQAGSQANVDTARASQKTAAAQLKAAQAQLHQSQISLGYTEITSPIDGSIGRTAVTVGNVVSPTSGTLATVVSVDPMYVVFPVAMRALLDLRDRYASNGGFDAVKIRIRLPNGKLYGPTGKLDFLDTTVAKDTDTIVLRGTIANPPIASLTVSERPIHELADGEFVTVSLEAVEPLKVLAVPRAAISSDQQGDYLYVVAAQNKAEQRRVKLGQSTPDVAAITDGIKEGDSVIVEGIQRVRPGIAVAPAPASASLSGK